VSVEVVVAAALNDAFYIARQSQDSRGHPLAVLVYHINSVYRVTQNSQPSSLCRSCNR